MLHFGGDIEDKVKRILQFITNWDHPLKTDWHQPEIAPIEKNRERFIPVSFRSLTQKNNYNIKQLAARAGFRRGQRREYDKV